MLWDINFQLNVRCSHWTQFQVLPLLFYYNSQPTSSAFSSLKFTSLCQSFPTILWMTHRPGNSIKFQASTLSWWRLQILCSVQTHLPEGICVQSRQLKILLELSGLWMYVGKFRCSQRTSSNIEPTGFLCRLIVNSKESFVFR